MAVLSTPLTGAARFFQEGTGPASSFCMQPRSLLVHFSWGKTIPTANNVCHLIVTLLVVIIVVRTLKYRGCTNIKVCDNNIRESAPFMKFVKIIDREHCATYGIHTNGDSGEFRI